MEFLSRSLPLLGQEGLDRLKRSHVCVVGLGGVGAACAEALVRAGVGHLTFVDGDSYGVTNKNRQLYATDETIGENKAAAAARRAVSISPSVRVRAVGAFHTPEKPLDVCAFDYVCDCIVSTPDKIDLICRAHEAGTPILSAMGAGGKLDPTRFRVCDLAKTHTCPLAKKMRVELRKRGVAHTKVVFSDEVSLAVTTPPASVSFVPPVMGFILAAEVIKTLALTERES